MSVDVVHPTPLPPGCSHLAPSARGGRTSHARLRPGVENARKCLKNLGKKQIPLKSLLFLCWVFAWLWLIIYIVFSQRLKSPSLRKMISEDLVMVMLTHPNAAWAAFACDFCRALVRRQVWRWIKMKRNTLHVRFQIRLVFAIFDVATCEMHTQHEVIDSFPGSMRGWMFYTKWWIRQCLLLQWWWMHSILLFVRFSQAKFLMVIFGVLLYCMVSIGIRVSFYTWIPGDPHSIGVLHQRLPQI